MKTQANQAWRRHRPTAAVAAILLGAGGVFGAITWQPSALDQSPLPAPVSIDAPAAGDAPVRVKCAECGVVESTRESADPAAALERAAKRSEVTIRMRDGAIRVFTETTTAHWRPGEHVILIDGAGLAND